MLAAETITGPADAMDRALRGGVADSVERWTLIAMTVHLGLPDRASALVADVGMAPTATSDPVTEWGLHPPTASRTASAPC